MGKRLRFSDLRERGIVRNRVTLRNWQKKYGFPLGQLIGPNSRAWTEAEVEKWLADRPTEPKQGTPKSRGRPRKADQAGAEA